MLGAIVGDIIGSIYEFENIKTTKFPLFGKGCFYTDDTVLTVALAESLLTGKRYDLLMKEYYRRYPDSGYGGQFIKWAKNDGSLPYNSWGNGSAMRISPVGWAFNTLEEVLIKAEEYTACTHDHPEGIKGAQATAAAIFLARSGSSKGDIRNYITDTFTYDLSSTCDVIRPTYRFDVSCQGTLPPALIAFLESTDFESAIRLAVSLGGDTDTLACITGSIAEAFYGGVPDNIAKKALVYLDDSLKTVAGEFVGRFVTSPPRSWLRTMFGRTG
ncbi:MAG: ADP-ribosylglycohydrolase family protein [Desulfuromonadaceae bacterium]